MHQKVHGVWHLKNLPGIAPGPPHSAMIIVHGNSFIEKTLYKILNDDYIYNSFFGELRLYC